METKRRNATFGVVALCLTGCASNDPNDWAVKSPEQAVAIAKKVCRDASKAHEGTWSVTLKGDTWVVVSEDYALNVWVVARRPDHSLCVDESK